METFRVRMLIGVVIDANNKEEALEKAAREVCDYTGDYLSDAEIEVEPYK